VSWIIAATRVARLLIESPIQHSHPHPINMNDPPWNVSWNHGNIHGIIWILGIDLYPFCHSFLPALAAAAGTITTFGNVQ